ncbi:MAG: hypothetical protein ACI8TQ_003366 [Planctomycetota bacterium]|jgi:hypothetical protein
MKTISCKLTRADADRRGAALMMAMMVLVVLILIASQIRISTMTDGRIARNQNTITSMDLAIESALLKVFEDLKGDAVADEGDGLNGAVGAGGGGAVGGAAGGLSGGGGEGGGGDGSATDSSRDTWATPGRTEINELQLRFYFQDEDSKYNVLNMLTENEDEATKARDRVIRILDLCREGTDEDIDLSSAESMADSMLDHMLNRSESLLPRPFLMTDDEEREELGLPMSLREFVVLDDFHPSHFRDYRDNNGEVVHSIESFLTLWTSLTTASELAAANSQASGGSNDGQSGTADPGSLSTASGNGANQQGGGTEDGEEGSPFGADEGADGAGAGSASQPGGQGASSSDGPKININRAPVAVLKALMDDRDVPMTFWDALVEFRNEEDEEETDPDDEPSFDEFGNELIIRKIFTTVTDLAKIEGWDYLEPIVQAEVRDLTTVSSNVFSIYITARRSTADSDETDFFVDEEEIEEDEQKGLDLLRTVRCVVWRRTQGDEAEIIPLLRWEVLDYVPFEVEDYPGEDR